jgi:hypothetical protein
MVSPGQRRAIENGGPLTKSAAAVHRFRVDAESVHQDRDLDRS